MINTIWIAWNFDKKWSHTTTIFSGGLAAYFFASPIENTLYSRKDLQRHLTFQEVAAKWSPPKAEKVLKALWVIQGIQAITLFYFRKYHLPSLVPLVGAIAAFYESSKRAWLQLDYHSDKTIVVQHNPLPPVKLTYHTLIFQTSPQDNPDCSICHNNSETPRNAFYCPEKHRYHLGCLVDSLASNLFRIGNLLDGRNLTYDEETKKVTFQVQEDILPHCPDCRGQTPVSVLSFNLGEIRSC